MEAGQAGVTKAMTQEQMARITTERLAYWRKRLRLEDWDVTVKIVRKRELESQIAGGECDFVFKKKRAQINILDPVDYPPDCLFAEDHELVLVHELLHLHLAALEDTIRFEDDNETETPAWIAIEQAIHAISEALVALEREKKPSSSP